MAKSYDAAGGKNVVTGILGKGMVKVGAGLEVNVWLQDWSLQMQFKTIDVTPIGFAGEWKVQAGKNASGSTKMNFRTDSEGQDQLIGLFFDVDTDGVVVPANNAPDVVWKFYISETDYFKAQIIIESASLGVSTGNAMSFDVSFSVKGVPLYVRDTI